VAPGDNAERPPTSRVGPAGGSGRGLRTVIVLASLALALAVLKPWDWIAAKPVAPGREGGAISGAVPTAAPTASPTSTTRDWANLGTRIACLSGTSWLAIVDQVDGPTTSRSWTHLDLVPANDPLDPAIVRTHVYAEAVPRIGFCAADLHVVDPAAAGDEPFPVRAWRLPSVLPTGASANATEFVPRIVSGGTLAEGGALFGPPGGLSVRGPAGQAADPEGAWAVGGSVPGAARWATRAGRSAQASWPPGTYVFRVDPAGAGSAGSGTPGSAAPSSGAAWFAIELRGPWVGPGASDAP